MDDLGIEVNVESTPARHAVHVAGYIDAGNVHVLRDHLTACPADRPMEIDLAGVTFLDSSGIGVFVGQWRRWAEAGPPIRLVEVPADIRRVLEITGLATMYDAPAAEA